MHVLISVHVLFSSFHVYHYSNICCHVYVGLTIAISVIVSFILILVLCIVIGVVSVLLYNKCRRGTGQSSSQPPIYEDPDEVTPDPNTEGNVAYGHVQQLNSGGHNRRGTGQSYSQPPTELKQVGPIYEEPEDFKPDPNTEGNVAYGHVQPLHHRQ